MAQHGLWLCIVCGIACSRSSKVAVALAAGGLVPPLLEPLMAAVAGPSGRSAAAAASSAPILRAKLLDIISIMYQHHPRPKEFIMKYRIQVRACRLTGTTSCLRTNMVSLKCFHSAT
jgi:hypothetical protein